MSFLHGGAVAEISAEKKEGSHTPTGPVKGENTKQNTVFTFMSKKSHGTISVLCFQVAKVSWALFQYSVHTIKLSDGLSFPKLL